MRIPFFGTFTRSAAPSAPSIEDITSTMRSEISMAVRAASINEADRSVEAVATTGNPVAMFDVNLWEVVDEILVPSGGTIPAEMPMLDSHQRHSIKNVLGGVFNPRMSNNEWIVKLTFDEGADGEDAFRKIRKRFVRDVSLGYQVNPDHVTYIQKGMTAEVNGVSYTASENRTLKVCSVWVGQEVSPTPIGADKDAKIRAAMLVHGKPKPKPAVRCDELAADLHDLIQDTGLPRDEVVSDMASAAGMSVRQVEEVLLGNTAPNHDQLSGFSAALECELRMKGTEGKGTGGKVRARIRELQNAGWTLEQIGSRVDRSASTLSSILSGEIKNPPQSLLTALNDLPINPPK